MDYIIQDGELYHHGVKGQRWGVRRFQNADGSLTNAGKKRISRKQKKALEKARKTKQEKAEAAKKAKQEQEDFEKNKKKALESGSAEDVLKYKGKLTNKELQDAFTRINLERQLSEISSKERKSGMDKVDSVMSKVDRMRANTEKGISAYNTMAKILNSTTNSDLPTIDGSKKKDKTEQKTREKFLKSATPEQIAKKFGTLTTKELEEVSKRFNYEDSIKKRIKTDDDSVKDGDKSSSSDSRTRKSRFKRDLKDTSAVWNKPASDVPDSTLQLGQTYIAGLLPAPRDRDD